MIGIKQKDKVAFNAGKEGGKKWSFVMYVIEFMKISLRNVVVVRIN